MKLTIQDRRAQTEAVPPASALIIEALKEPPETEKTLSTVEIPLLTRLSTLPNTCSTDLYLENSLEPLQRSWRLPSPRAEMQMATLS